MKKRRQAKLRQLVASRYAVPLAEQRLAPAMRRRLLADFIRSFDVSETVIVCKVVPGAAKLVARLLAAVSCPDVIGFLAGQDTVLVAVRSPEKVAGVLAAFDRIRRR